MTNTYRRRSLGQRLVDATGVGVAWLAFIVPVLIMARRDRKAGAR